jgi:hypothetical protein
MPKSTAAPEKSATAVQAPRKSIDVDIAKELKAAITALAPAAKRLTVALAKLDPKKIPSGTASDLLYDLRQVARQLSGIPSAVEDLVTSAIKLLEEHFINTLATDNSTGLQGARSRVQVTDSVVPVIKPEDWNKFYAYVAKTKQWELLGHKVSTEAIRERWAQKRQVKFVGVFHAKRVSVTKLGGK